MTKIEWTDATWNPVTGCSKVSQGCKNCYAERVFQRPYPGRAFTDVRTHPERLEAPLHWKKPRRIFVNSMSDLFHEDVPDAFIDDVFAVMALSQGDWGWFRFGRNYAAEGDPLNGRHTFQILTKRPERMRAYMLGMDFQRIIDASLQFVHLEDYDYDWAWPLPNVWLGVSVEDQATADERIPLLLQTPAAVYFVSCEPLLGPIDLEAIPRNDPEHPHPPYYDSADLDWVIAGGESGPRARPSHPDWFRSLRDQCAAAGVAYFFKQWGEHVPGVIDDPADGSLVFHDEYGTGVEVSGRHRKETQQGCNFVRVGKKAAGRTLDGRTHDEYPA